ncbi:HesA/MoeB/ThiF family protein [Salmonella enterica]|nr:HesA/MoeB/ThiF family protein [Salmonella enterica]
MNIERYERQCKVIGLTGQEKLKNSSILIVGCGGLGCPVALYATSAGIGKITIIDDDIVSLSNLHRQILFGENDIGLSKVTVAKEKLLQINSEIKIIDINDRLNVNNADEYISGHDLVIVGCDNIATRYVINDICCKKHIPYINASVLGDEGAITFFDITHGCYRCLFPDIPTDNSIPLPDNVGVLGPLVGVIGTSAATMAIEVLIGNEFNYINKIFTFDSKTLRMKAFPFSADKHCNNCSI